jgi:hypothetical protein
MISFNGNSCENIANEVLNSNEQISEVEVWEDDLFGGVVCAE